MSSRAILLLLAACTAIASTAQNGVLTLEAAVNLALQKNFDVRIAQDTREQAANNSTMGNAGMLPKVGLNGSYSGTEGSVQQTLSSGSETDENNAITTATSANVALSWTVFDGLKMFATRKKLEQLALQGERSLKERIENTVANVTDAYFNVVQQHQAVASAQVQVAAAQEAVNISQRKYANGSGSKLDLLVATTSLNAQRSAEIQAMAATDVAKVNLRQLLALPPDTLFEVQDTVIISYDPSLESLRHQASQANSSIRLLETQQRISAFGLKEYQAGRLPSLELDAGYQYSRSSTNASFLRLNQSLGTQWGITASWPLFNGFQLNTQIKNAKLAVHQADLAYEQGSQAVDAEVLSAFRNFQAAKEVLTLEEGNIQAAREVLDIALAQYGSGSSTIIDLKEAQSTFSDATDRLVAARYNTKSAETELRRLAGDLVK